MESAADTQISQKRPGAFVSNMTRSRTANAAALGPVDMRPTTGSRRAFINVWSPDMKRRRCNLKTQTDKDERRRYICQNAARCRSSATWLIASMFVEPVAPNISATP